MNSDNQPQNTTYTPLSTSSKKSRKKLITAVVIIFLLLAGTATYFIVANVNGFWPFDTDKSATKKVEPSLKIEKITLTGEKGKEVLNIKLKLDSNDTGYCVLTMTSRTARLTIDDSKISQKSKDAVMPQECLGWSLGTASLPNGDYKIDVKFVGAKTKLSTSDKVTLEGRAEPTEASDAEK